MSEKEEKQAALAAEKTQRGESTGSKTCDVSNMDTKPISAALISSATPSKDDTVATNNTETPKISKNQLKRQRKLERMMELKRQKKEQKKSINWLWVISGVLQSCLHLGVMDIVIR